MMYNKVNNVRETHGKKEEAIPMARKWLSGVLAFTMVFGCTAPMALAEEAPVENVEEMGDVEQYANYLPELSESEITLKAGESKEIKVTGLPETATLTPVATATNLTFEYDGVSRTLKVTADDAFEKANAGTFMLQFAAASGDYVEGVTLKVAFPDATVEFDTVNFGAFDGATTLGVDSEITVDASESATATPGPATDVAVKAEVGSDEYFSTKVVEVTKDGKVTGHKVVVTPKKVTPSGKKFEITVSARPAANKPAQSATYDITVADSKIVSVQLKTSATEVAASSDLVLIPQVYTTNKYGEMVQVDNPQNLKWYVDGTEMKFNGSNTFEVNDVLDASKKVTFTKSDANGTVTMNSTDMLGDFRITVSDATGDLSASKTITVKSDDKVEATDKVAFVGKDNKIEDSEIKVLPGASVDLGAKKLAVVSGADAYKATVAQMKGEVSYEIVDTTEKLVASVDKNGVVTIKNDANMEALLEKYNGTYPIHVAVKAKFPVEMINGGDQTRTLSYVVNVTKATDEATELEVKAGENVLENEGNMVLTAGTPVTLTWKVMDKNGFTEGLNQKMIWTVKNFNPFTDNNVYATIDSATGVVTPLMESAGKAYLEGVSVADPDLYIRVALYITAADVKPTAEPTAEPSVEPTTEPTAEPTAEPTTAPVQKGKVATSSSSLNVRETPDGEKIGSLKKGTIVTILGKDGDWLLVTDGDLTGYVAARYIEIIEDKPVDPETGVATVKTAGSALNMRQSPSTSAKIITKIANGSTVTVVEKGEKWTKVKYNGKTGYVSTQYLEFEEDAVG